jgi:hypothetical protein
VSVKQYFLFAGISFFFAAGFVACNNQAPAADATGSTVPPSKLLVFDKLVGLWQSQDGKIFERWTRNDDGTYQAVVFSIKGSDTSWKEQASIYPENDQWIFENRVNDQNNGKAVKFSAAVVSETTVQFTNPAHDFPTDVNYTVPDPNTVNAFIVGPNSKGGKDTIPFTYSRLN